MKKNRKHNHLKVQLTMSPRHTIGAPSSTRKPIDILKKQKQTKTKKTLLRKALVQYLLMLVCKLHVGQIQKSG